MKTQVVARGPFNTNSWHRVRWALWAPVYDLAVRVLEARRRRSLELANLRAGEDVLLLGAGTGLDLEFLPPGLRVAAIDIAPAMLSRLRRRARRLALHVESRIMDGQSLDFPDGSFDVVILHLIVAVIPDPVRCLKEVRRVLRDGGRVAIFDKFIPDEGEPALVVRWLAPIASFFGTEVTRRLGPLLGEAGLERVAEEPAGLRGLYRIALARKASAAERIVVAMGPSAGPPSRPV